MKDTELRIGNIVEFSSPNLRLNIHEKFHTVSSMDIINFSSKKILLESIPLTEDILLRFGFSDKDYKDGFIGVDVNHTNFVLTKPNNPDHYDFKYYSWEFKNDSWPKYLEFQYVHQLQNFYFALTGEELILQ